MRPAVLLSAALVLLSAGAAAQSPAEPDAAAPRRYVQSVATNPIAVVFGVFSAEYERVVAAGFTFGVGGSYVSGDVFDDGYDDGTGDDSRLITLQGKLLYYPNEKELRGFSVGITAGYISARDERYGSYDPFYDNIAPPPQSQTVTDGAPTLGVILDYNWLLGRRKRFLVGTGIGARRVLMDVGGSSPLEQVYPDGRLVVGVAF